MSVKVTVAILVFAFSGALRAQITAPDQKTLSQLRAAGSNLSKPHKVDHWLYFKNQTDAAATAKDLLHQGFSEVSGAPFHAEWRVKAPHRFVPAPEAVANSTKPMESLAAAHCGEYDDWETQVVE